ncbi:MAG: phosphomethylpyrimidine synthase ThiC, partial [Methylococcales bacterium]
MSVIPEKFVSGGTIRNEAKIPQFPASEKIYIQGSRPDIRVPMRKISLSPTRSVSAMETNCPVFVYDTSGPYTDQSFATDLLRGLPAVRSRWIVKRNDSEEFDGPTSEYGRRRLKDRALDRLRFEHLR